MTGGQKGGADATEDQDENDAAKTEAGENEETGNGMSGSTSGTQGTKGANQGGTQASQAMLIDGKLPGQELVDRQRVTAACLLEGEQAAADRGHDFGLAADYPPFGSGRGQVRNC